MNIGDLLWLERDGDTRATAELDHRRKNGAQRLDEALSAGSAAMKPAFVKAANDVINNVADPNAPLTLTDYRRFASKIDRANVERLILQHAPSRRLHRAALPDLRDSLAVIATLNIDIATEVERLGNAS